MSIIIFDEAYGYAADTVFLKYLIFLDIFKFCSDTIWNLKWILLRFYCTDLHRIVSSNEVAKKTLQSSKTQKA